MRNITPACMLVLLSAAVVQGDPRKPPEWVAERLAIISPDSKQPLELQQKMSHELEHETRGTMDPAVVVGPLSDVVRRHPDDYVRHYAIRALGALKHESTIPTLIFALNDKGSCSSEEACAGLRELGPRANAATPVLNAGIEDHSLPDAALGALHAIEGEAARDFVLKLAARPNLDDGWQHQVGWALYESGDPRAVPFFGRAAESESHTFRVLAILYFARLKDDASLPYLRNALEPVPHKSDHDRSELQTIAAVELGARKDMASFDRIQKLGETASSILLRTGVARSLAKYADPRSVPLLASFLKFDDTGLSSEGHRDGELHAQTVAALAAIGDDAALEAIYSGLFSNELAVDASKAFWSESTAERHYEKFLSLYAARPAAGQVTAKILDAMLRTREKTHQLTDDNAAAAEKDFAAHVQDDANFGPAANLSQGGRYKVEIHRTFYKGDVAGVSFTTSAPGTTIFWRVIYRKVEGKWIPLGETIRGIGCG